MMRRSHILLLGCLLLALRAEAQQPSADDYFNRAARHYVQEDKLAALKALDLGLRQYPGDARMLKLAEELLKEQQQQQKQQQQQQQQQEQEKQEQEKQAEERSAEEEERQQRQGQMTKEEAERMLDALEHKEQDVQDRVRTKLRSGKRVPIEKDW